MKYKIYDKDGLTEEMIRQAVELDETAYTEKYQRGVYEACVGCHRRNRNVYAACVDEDNNRVAAYATIIPLRGESYRLLKEGEISDDKIKSEDVAAEGERFDGLYMASVVVGEEYQGDWAVLRRITQYVRDKIAEYGDVEAIADAVSDGGRRMCSLFGMEKYKSTERGSEIYIKYAIKQG